MYCIICTLSHTDVLKSSVYCKLSLTAIPIWVDSIDRYQGTILIWSPSVKPDIRSPIRFIHFARGAPHAGSPITESSDAFFGMGALNVMSRLSRNQFTTYFPRLLRLFVGLRLSAMALVDTGTTDGLEQLDPTGVSVRSHTMPDGSTHSVHSLWSLMGLSMGGRPQKSGSSVALLWDSSLSYEDPWTDAHGRAAAVTLLGAGKKATRVMAAYGYASPGNWGNRPKALLDAVTVALCPEETDSICGIR